MSRYGYPSDSDFDEGPAFDGPPVRASVKWFNATKGFGFVSPTDGTPDAFLHVSVLSRIGLSEVSDGAEMVCIIGRGAKGPQVTRVLEVIGGGTAAPPRRERAPRPEPTGPTLDTIGTVKWFKPDKGFGFVIADDSDKDIFVHKTVLRQSGIDSLDSGQRVRLKVVEAPKGREATWIELLD